MKQSECIKYIVYILKLQFNELCIWREFHIMLCGGKMKYQFWDFLN